MVKYFCDGVVSLSDFCNQFSFSICIALLFKILWVIKKISILENLLFVFDSSFNFNFQVQTIL